MVFGFNWYTRSLEKDHWKLDQSYLVHWSCIGLFLSGPPHYFHCLAKTIRTILHALICFLKYYQNLISHAQRFNKTLNSAGGHMEFPNDTIGTYHTFTQRKVTTNTSMNLQNLNIICYWISFILTCNQKMFIILQMLDWHNCCTSSFNLISEILIFSYLFDFSELQKFTYFLITINILLNTTTFRLYSLMQRYLNIKSDWKNLIIIQ